MSQAPDATPLLRVRGLSAGHGHREILRDISFDLFPGQNLGILGPNGCGKTTLLRVILGDLKPLAGSVEIAGTPQPSAKNRARVMAGAASGEGRPNFTTIQHTLLGRYPWLSWLGFYSDADRAIASDALAAVGMAENSSKNVGALSEGQWRLATLARALAQIAHLPTAILALDEPGANLDINHKMRIYRLLDKLRHNGLAIVQAMHDCNLAAMFCDYLLGIKNGEQLFYGPVERCFTAENISALYDWPVGVRAHPDFNCPQVYPRFQ